MTTHLQYMQYIGAHLTSFGIEFQTDKENKQSPIVALQAGLLRRDGVLAGASVAEV